MTDFQNYEKKEGTEGCSQAVPEQLWDKHGYWVGLSCRDKQSTEIADQIRKKEHFYFS